VKHFQDQDFAKTSQSFQTGWHWLKKALSTLHPEPRPVLHGDSRVDEKCGTAWRTVKLPMQENVANLLVSRCAPPSAVLSSG
jgi:hypothetical protein